KHQCRVNLRLPYFRTSFIDDIFATMVNGECSKDVTLDKKLIQSSPFYSSDDDHSEEKVSNPSKFTSTEYDKHKGKIAIGRLHVRVLNGGMYVRAPKHELDRCQSTTKEAKYTVGLTFNSSNG
nr:putative elongation factor TypA-like SVR3, chloroplastic [Tanacetum cinerariifolium]